MKNKILNRTILGILATVAFACQPKKEEVSAAPTVDKDQIKTEIQSLETAFADAMNVGKSETIIYYSDDVVSYDQNATPLMGKKAVDAKLAEQVKKMVKGDKLSYTANEIFPSNDGNQVVELGSYKVIDSTDTLKHSGNYMSLFEKRDGKYICIRDMGASDQPVPEKK